MSSTAEVRTRDTRSVEPGPQPLDLAALGQTWTPPEVVDTTPEVADVLSEMPWWAARGLLYIIAGFLVTALVWAHLSQVDVVVESRGTLVPAGYTRPVQAASGGEVQYVFVRKGETVERGQPLLQLDATEPHARLSRLRDELATTQEQMRQLRALKGPVAETLEQENRLARLQSDIAAAELNLKHTILTSPVAGRVTTLDVRGGGTVLQAGQTVATIVPTGARLLVETLVPNKDMALVERGLPAKLKFDAFPFHDYGAVHGTIVDVAPDAETSRETGSFYKVLIAPATDRIVAKGKTVALRPGLTLTAEVVTERRSVLSLILEPFRKLKSGLTST